MGIKRRNFLSATTAAATLAATGPLVMQTELSPVGSAGSPQATGPAMSGQNMSNFQLPFQPIRSTLYSPSELSDGLDLNVPSSFASTRDFLIYRYFIAKGGTNSGDYLTTMMESLHDNSITVSARALLDKRKCVAIMGGHDMDRTDPAYSPIAELARALTRAGYIVASGGGPGAMEASHLGAACANSSDSVLPEALKVLSAQPQLPQNLEKILDSSGAPNAALVAQAHAWVKVAWQAIALVSNPGESLALPTWRYGQEPSTPLASHIAKYFQNSIREDGLISIGTYGVVFAPGKAGTIQEIFQNATNNYYQSFGTFSPMVFLGRKYWTTDYPVMAVMEKLFKPEQIKKHVLVTDEIEKAIKFISNSQISAGRSPTLSFQLQARARTSGTLKW